MSIGGTPQGQIQPARPDYRNVVLLSGGLDSTAILASLAAQQIPTANLFVAYGQSTVEHERLASRAVAAHFEAPWCEVSVEGINVAEDEILGRNGLLVSIALTALTAVSPASIYLGIHAGTPYRDCSPEFVALAQQQLDFHADGQVQLVTPFLHWHKQTIFLRARELGAPVDLTHSCERASACGQCRSCKDREALFAASTN